MATLRSRSRLRSQGAKRTAVGFERPVLPADVPPVRSAAVMARQSARDVLCCTKHKESGADKANTRGPVPVYPYRNRHKNKASNPGLKRRPYSY